MNLKNIIVTVVLCFVSIVMNAQTKVESIEKTLSPGETVNLPENFIRTDVVLKASVQFKKFEKILLGCGPDCYCGGWLEINPETYTFYDRSRIGIDTTGKEPRQFFDTVRVSTAKWNDRPLKKNLSISIRSYHGKADLEMSSGSHIYKGIVKKWSEGGIPFLTNCGSKPIKVCLSYERLKADQPIWFYGDSYFNTRNDYRWPFYMYREGYCNWMADQLAGGCSPRLLECFKHDLKFGTPEIAVWMLGMNDGSDKDGKPCEQWLSCVEEFIAICKEKGIEPVLTTVPTVPERQHDAKTEWVRSSGYRYIDWYKACGTDSEGKWFDGYIHDDYVHPSQEGAKALWRCVQESLPELSK